MSTSYGKQIANALAAIQQLHADCSKLLTDCDGTIGQNRTPLFGNEVTRDFSRAISGYYSWTPAALYRYYYAHDDPSSLIVGVTICFFDDDMRHAPRHDEPLILVGEIHSANESNLKLRSHFNPWTLWNGFFKGLEQQLLGQVLSLEKNDVDKTPAMRLIAAPLYDITSVEDVQAMLNRVRTEVSPT
jgi:hypothetical protein